MEDEQEAHAQTAALLSWTESVLSLTQQQINPSDEGALIVNSSMAKVPRLSRSRPTPTPAQVPTANWRGEDGERDTGQVGARCFTLLVGIGIPKTICPDLHYV